MMRPIDRQDPEDHEEYGYTGGLKCICCEHWVSQNDQSCKFCQTPIGLSMSASQRRGRSRFFSVLGASNAGKTVYLGLLLDLLSKGSERLRGLATGAFSVSLQHQVVTALERRMFPDKTPNEADHWKWLHCQVTVSGAEGERHVDLIAPDFAGEAIASEIEQAGVFPAIRHVVAKSAGLLILVDSVKVRDAGPSEDLFAMKMAAYIAQSQDCLPDPGCGPRGDGPGVAIVFTKSDGCREAERDATAFAATHTPRLLEFCRQAFERHKFFAAGVVGSGGTLIDAAGRRLNVPLHVEPRGVSEPLEWLVCNSKPERLYVG